ncbi:hypothetical protein [Methylorubrum sp. GM97]|uniref:hypothetical protein n=1 Tax=Methylorubrum sp. GM97 TaxID=2938232 RepID=UPI00218B7DF3|nr:hypothetical protein [Methylorubrum sp. GM97]BDL41100.1 hypothetical protein MSPGM_36900 [Methylorubrum sp. GM97]
MREFTRNAIHAVQSTSSAAVDSVRDFLAAVVDADIAISEILYREAKREIIDNKSISLDPSVFLFDEQYYLSSRGIPATDMSPIRDYFEYGVQLGYAPHPLVNPSHIVEQVSLVRDSQADLSSLNPLTALFAAPFGSLSPNTLFDNEIYRAYLANVAASDRTVSAVCTSPPVAHYLKNWRTLRRIVPLAFSGYFDPEFYNMQSNRSGDELIDPLSSYYSKPVRDREDCNSRFHGRFYAGKYSVHNVDPLEHFIKIGAGRGNLPNPFALTEIGLEHLSAPPALIEKILLEYTRIKGGTN